MIVLIAIVAHHGRPVVTWINSKPFCNIPIGDHPPSPSEANVGSPSAFRLLANSSTGAIGAVGIVDTDGSCGIAADAWMTGVALGREKLGHFTSLKVESRCFG